CFTNSSSRPSNPARSKWISIPLNPDTWPAHVARVSSPAGSGDVSPPGPVELSGLTFSSCGGASGTKLSARTDFAAVSGCFIRCLPGTCRRGGSRRFCVQNKIERVRTFHEKQVEDRHLGIIGGIELQIFPETVAHVLNRNPGTQ